MDIPSLGGSAEGSWFGNNHPHVDVRCQTVANFIVNQPIYELCVGAVRKRGSPVRPFWCDHPMDLDLVRERGIQPLSQQGRGQVANDNDKDNKLDGL